MCKVTQRYAYIKYTYYIDTNASKDMTTDY